MTQNWPNLNLIKNFPCSLGLIHRRMDLSEDGQCMTFVHLAKAIPWVIPQQHATRPLRWLLPSDGRHGYELTHAGHKLSADRLRVAGLDPGDYEVRIDGTLIGVWSHLALGSKIELQTNPKTPQYQQALQVAKLNRQTAFRRRHRQPSAPARRAGNCCCPDRRWQ